MNPHDAISRQMLEYVFLCPASPWEKIMMGNGEEASEDASGTDPFAEWRFSPCTRNSRVDGATGAFQVPEECHSF